MTKLAIGFALASIVFAGCSSSGASTTGGTASPGASSSPGSSGSSKAKTDAPASTGEAKAAKADDSAPKKLDKLGLTVTAPAGADVNEMGDTTMVSGGGTALTIKAATDTDPKTVDDGKSGALLGDKGRNLKGDKTADGWVVTWENTGSAGDNYWLSMRREINKKAYMCETTVSSEDQRKAAIAMCNSLK
jgi:hypothetical protein